MKVVLLFYKHCVRCGQIDKTDELLEQHFHSYLIFFKGDVEFVINSTMCLYSSQTLHRNFKRLYE